MNRKAARTSGEAGTDADLQYVRAFQDFVGELFRLNTLYLGTADKYIQDLNVTTAEWRVIASIQFGDSKTVPQVARWVGISRQAVRQTIQKLEAKGYIRLDDNPDHRRSSLISLTAEGSQIMRALTQKQSQLTHLFTDGLGFDTRSITELGKQLETLREHAESVTSYK